MDNIQDSNRNEDYLVWTGCNDHEMIVFLKWIQWDKLEKKATGHHFRMDYSTPISNLFVDTKFGIRKAVPGDTIFKLPDGYFSIEQKQTTPTQNPHTEEGEKGCTKPNCDCIERYEEKHGEPPKYGYPCLHPRKGVADEANATKLHAHHPLSNVRQPAPPEDNTLTICREIQAGDSAGPDNIVLDTWSGKRGEAADNTPVAIPEGDFDLFVEQSFQDGYKGKPNLDSFEKGVKTAKMWYKPQLSAANAKIEDLKDKVRKLQSVIDHLHKH